MFTGIITDIGTIASIQKNANDMRIGIYTNFDDIFLVDVSAESISKTNIGSWEEGTKINLEAALKMGDELGGHIVSGHVDGLATLKSITPDGDSYRLKIEVPQDLKSFIASKGSVALDGVSLTVNEVQENMFGVNIIPHTWDNTTLGKLSEGDTMHLEIDMLARYMARMLECQK